MFGEEFPYTNFHDLNLDWIVKTLKDVANKYSEIDEVASEAEEILQKIDELGDIETEFNALQEEVNALLIRINQIADSIYIPMTNVICLTDSYGSNDPANNRYSWCDALKDDLGLTSDTYLKIYYAGASFGDDDPTKNLTDIFIAGTQNLSSERKSAISDLLIVSGINEWNESRTIMQSKMEELNTYVRANFPNAKIWLFAVQWDKLGDVRYHTMGNPSANTYNLYRTYATSYGWEFVQNLSAMVYTSTYVDDVHPNTAGSRMIKDIIKSAILGHMIEFNTGIITNVQIQTSSNTRNAGGIFFDGTKFVWSASPFSCDALPDLPSGFNGAIKLGTLVTSAIIGGDYNIIANPVNIPCTLGLYNGSWHNVPGTATIKMINGTPELWFRNNGYFAEVPTPGYQNITDSYLYFGSVTIPLWD